MIDFYNHALCFDKLFSAYQDYILILLRWVLGLSMASHFVYCQVLFDWLIELSILDYLLTLVLDFCYENLLPVQLHSPLLKSVCLRLIGLWILSGLIGEPLLVILFSYTLYWLFVMYAREFSRKPLESLSLWCYFSSFWFVFPVILNLMASVAHLFEGLNDVTHDFLSFIGGDRILREWGFEFKTLTPKLRSSPIKEAMRRSIFVDLSSVQQKYYQRIQNKYLSTNPELVLSENLDDLKRIIQNFYHENPVAFCGHSLPLSWEDFLRYRTRFGSRDQYHAFQSYFQHDIHGAWRFISDLTPWTSQETNNLKRRHTVHQSKNLEFLLLMWLELKNQYQHEINHRLEHKQREFILILSRWNRLENKCAEKRADQAGSIPLLYASLWTLVVAKPTGRPLSPLLLIQYLESFLQTKWMHKLSQLPNAELHNLEKTHEDPNFKWENYALTAKEKAEFHQNMELLHGHHWQQSSETAALLGQYFPADRNHLDLHLHQGLFARTLSLVKSSRMNNELESVCP